MSVQAITWVLDKCPDVRGAERLVLMSIANHADNVGGNSWPSVSTIAREAALGETRTKAAIKSLRMAGVIEVEPNAGGSRDIRADRRPNRYTILPMAVDNSETDGGHGGQTGDPGRGSRGSENGGHEGHTGDHEPSLTRPDSPSSPPPDEFTIAALRSFAQRTTKNEASKTTIRHPHSYERTVYTKACDDLELRAKVDDLRAMYPTIIPQHVGVALAGEASILSGYRRAA